MPVRNSVAARLNTSNARSEEDTLTVYNRNGWWDFPHIDPVMTTKITLDRAGRVLIPKTLRRELHLGAGDALQLESKGEEITLRPVRTKALLKKERGVWVYQGEIPKASVVELIDSERDRRSRELMG